MRILAQRIFFCDNFETLQRTDNSFFVNSTYQYLEKKQYPYSSYSLIRENQGKAYAILFLSWMSSRQNESEDRIFQT